VAGRLNRVGGGRAAFRAVCRRGSLVLVLVGAGCGGKAVLDDAERTMRADASEDRRDGSVDATGSADEPSDGNLAVTPDAGTEASAHAEADARVDAGAIPDSTATPNPNASIDADASLSAGTVDAAPEALPGVCSCPAGCCDPNGVCQSGSVDALCGQGEPCADCTASGRVCRFQTCVYAPEEGGEGCNGVTCPSGCCDFNGNCQQGLTGIACGQWGRNCLDCAAVGKVCSNQQCAAPSGRPPCNQECRGGCCDVLGNCLAGTLDTQCGQEGQVCADCTTSGGQCAAGSCVGADGGPTCVDTCGGCCDAVGNCQSGFLDTQCSTGFPGDLCQDCTQLDPPSTCDINAGACASQRMTCPSAYVGCPAALQEAPPAVQAVCSMNELENAAAACAVLDDVQCLDFQMASSGSPCFACLQTFAFGTPVWVSADTEATVSPLMQASMRACVAPYVDATCNHNSACIADCLTEVCLDCVADLPDGGDACVAQAQSGTCASYLALDSCVTDALSGPAAFCDPATYSGNFGAWLLAVGTHYCGE
jgi:hypothetical protein